MSRWIRRPDDLAALASRLRGARAVALDSESDSLHHYREKVCLVQIATDSGEAVLVDPLELRDLSPLAPVLADPGITKVLHGADYDVSTLKRDFGFAFASVFDTMLAARLLGRPEIGLQAMVRAELGVELLKDSQKDDWSRRPLSPRQEDYALADVRHLLSLHERLVRQLEDAGRLAWALEESAAVADLPPARRERNPLAWQEVKGARALKPRGLAVLREVHAWREEQAAARDVPSFKILGTEALLALAERAPRTTEELRAIRGLPPSARHDPKGLLAAVERACAAPEAELPVLPRNPKRPSPTDLQKRREAALKAWRKTEAERLQVDVSVVLPQRLVDRLVDEAPASPEALLEVPGLRRWRVAAFGPALLKALRES